MMCEIGIIGPSPPLTREQAAKLRPILQEAQITFSDAHSNVVGIIGGYSYKRPSGVRSHTS
jgi:hypothetical protein